MTMLYRHPHKWPPVQRGEAAKWPVRWLWRYAHSHHRWTGRLDPRRDNYLALHRAVSVNAELRRRLA